MTDLRKSFSRGVYIHAVGGPLSHNAGCLAEGMMDLGLSVKLSTRDVTSRPLSAPLQGKDLAPHVSPPYSGYAGYIVDITHTNQFTPFEGTSGRIAYVNNSDVAAFTSVPDAFPLFAVHENRFATKGGARHPIAFGLSHGLIAATEQRPDFAQRRKVALRNFRATLNQSVRALLDVSFVPALTRHMPVNREILATEAYRDALLNSAVCLAYGGDFYSPIRDNRWFARHEPDIAAIHAFQRVDAPGLVMRWDSFRLWESLAAGCLTVHLDFEKYGFALPIMPQAWVHYVPIDLDNITGSVEQLLDRTAEWPTIAAQGRAWAIAHYAPMPTANRILSTLLAHSIA